MTMRGEPNSAGTPDDRELRLWQLNGQQSDLGYALISLDRNGELARMYLAGVWLRSNLGFPDGIALAAHALRELMKSLPKALDLPMKARAETLGNRAEALRSEWEKAIRKSGCMGHQGWEGTIDAPLGSLLAALGDFVQWLVSHRPRMKGEVLDFMQTVGGVSPSVPASVRDKKAKAWMDLYDYFSACAHHGINPDIVEFEGRCQELEGFLVDHLSPRPTEDMQEIDQLIRRWET